MRTHFSVLVYQPSEHCTDRELFMINLICCSASFCECAVRHTDNEVFSQGNENSIHFIANPEPIWKTRDVQNRRCAKEKKNKIKEIEPLFNSSIFIR